MDLKRLIFVLTVVLTGSLLLQSCATSSDQPNYSSEPDDMEIEGNRHPASYFIDRFQVPKEIPKHKKENRNLPFFYKRCNVAGRDWAERQYYDCDVGF